MRKILISLVTGLLLLGCKTSTTSKKSNLTIANHFIEVFYSFDKDSLQAILKQADESSKQSILYYQRWAECGNYKVINRHNYVIKNDSVIICPITVKDDLIGALKIDFNVTDTFHLTIVYGWIRSIQTSSNDPQQYYQAKEWVKQSLPDLVEIPCEGIWEDGTTPCECVKAMIEGFSEFVVRNADN